MSKRASAVFLSLVCLLYSCGYTVRSGIRQDVSRVHVSLFGNETYEHSIEVDLARLTSREFIMDGTLSVSEPQNAEGRIAGTVTEYMLEPYAYGAEEADVEQYRLRIRAEVRLEALPGGEVLWREGVLEGETLYHAGGALAKTEDDARNEALTDLARRIVRRTVGAW